MSYKLTIEFGGLCMFVQQASPSGLFVFLPEMKDAAEEHCPMLLTWKNNEQSGHNWLAPFHEIRNLSGADASRRSIKLPSGMLNISSYAGHKRVAPKWFNATAPTTPLAASLVLPLGTSIVRAGDAAKLLVPGSSRAGEFYGLATAEINVSNPKYNPLKIAGRTLKPDMATNEIAIRLVNVPRAQLDGKRRGSKKGRPIAHVQAYYGLLDGSGGMGMGPDVLQWETSEPDEPLDPPASCPTHAEHYKDWRSPLFYIDPLNCTVGIGCPTVEPC